MTESLPPRILKARLGLMLGHPYLATALARLPVVNAAGLGWCETMATDGYLIYVNPAFCERLTDEEIAGVFAHELLHCILGHGDRRGSRQRILWNLAIDFATNQLLREFGFTLPDSALYHQRYATMTAEQIYDFLEKAGLGNCTGGFDLHLEPGDAEGAAQRSKDYLSAEERRRLRNLIMHEMMKELARKKGTLPAELQREIERATRSQVSWQQLLARFLSGLRRSDYRLFPFNRKHLWRGLYLPSLGLPGPDHLVLAIDTSGSMSPADLGQLVHELDRLRALTECRLTLLQCDATVHRADEVPAGEKTVLPRDLGGRRLVGGGGTDFRPVFDWIAEQEKPGVPRPDALIYCTDGMGTFPPRAPRYPLVWVVTATGRPQFPFGLVIRLKQE